MTGRCVVQYMSIGSRVHVAVSRNGLDCSLYINGQLSGRSVSAVSVAYKNAFLVFGVDYRNNSNYFKGTMDHIAIYSQSLSDSEINALYNAEVGAPTPSPSNAAGSGSSSSSGGGGGGDNIIFLLAIVLPVVIGVAGICAVYHIYYKEKSDQDHRAATYAGLNTVAIGTAI